MALFLFIIIGCVGAVILGRIEDIVLYMLYTDKKSGLPNREKLNVYINELSKKLLPEDFSCIAIRLDNLDMLNKRFGYAVGDGVLKDFADIIKVMGDTDGVLGHNGAGNYDVFFERCNDKKAAIIIKVLAQQVDIYNNLHPNYRIEFSAASETSTASGIYDIRELLRSAKRKLSVQSNTEKETEK